MIITITRSKFPYGKPSIDVDFTKCEGNVHIIGAKKSVVRTKKEPNMKKFTIKGTK